MLLMGNMHTHPTKKMLKEWTARMLMDSDILFNKIPHICEVVHRLRRDFPNFRNKKGDYDYPAVVAECCINNYPNQTKVFYSRSHKLRNKNYYTDSRLLSKMTDIGGLGKAGDFKQKWKIGNCAEQRAAELLLRENKSCQLSDISFSTPIRPRTLEVIPYCRNCSSLFNCKNHFRSFI